jgi:hypothetical protein
MQYLALVRRKVESFTEEQFQPVLGPEADRVKELYAKGTIRAAYSRGDVKGAVVHLECDSLEKAEEVLNSLPLAEAGMIDWQLLPVLPYRGFCPAP